MLQIIIKWEIGTFLWPKSVFNRLENGEHAQVPIIKIRFRDINKQKS